MNRQDRNCRTSPDSVGPMAGANEIAMVMFPMTTPRRSAGTSVSTVVISNGIITAVPEACTTRANSSIQKPGETAASKVPAENKPIASMKTVRVEIRCSRNPVVGMTTAIVSMKAVVSHCTVRAEIPRSTINRGSATLMIVSFKITTKAVTSRIAMTWRSRAGSGCETPWPEGLGAPWLVLVLTRTILTLSTLRTATPPFEMHGAIAVLTNSDSRSQPNSSPPPGATVQSTPLSPDNVMTSR